MRVGPFRHGRLLSGTAPLRGRAGLELIIPPLDHRLAAQFRGIEDPDRLGGLPAKVGAGVLNDAAGRSAHEVDVVVTGIPDGRTPLLAIGEAKWNELTGIGHLERLRHFKSVIDSRNRYDTSQTRIACFSGAGFTSDLVAAAASAPDVLLISPAELYGLSDEKPPARASSR